MDTQHALEQLLDVARSIVAGNAAAVDRLMDMTSDAAVPPLVNELAECLGRLVVGLEAREYRVEMMLEDLLAKQLELEAARHDALTGLPNRVIFHEHLKRSFEAAKRSPLLLAVLFIDLDKFKPVNDSLGHEAGDELLKTVAERLGQGIRGSDVAARLGGDEFAVILDGLHSKEEAWIIANRLLEALQRPFALQAGEVRIGGSIGMAFYPGDGDNPTALLKSADMAMYRAKSEGRNMVKCYAPGDEQGHQEEIASA